MRSAAGVAAVAVLALAAFPAVSSADVTWTESDGMPLGWNDDGGPDGYDSHRTLNVSGTIGIDSVSMGGRSLEAECDVTGEVEVWNDAAGYDYSQGRNRIASLDMSNCEGHNAAYALGHYCNVVGATAVNVPWTGSLASAWSTYANARIDWAFGGGCGTTSSLPTTGSLSLPHVIDPVSGYCVAGFDLDTTSLWSSYGTVDISGSLDVDSVDGIAPGNEPDCVGAL
jgi:hypothetical protein